MSDHRPDPVGDLIESAKKHPVETYLAYQVLTPEEKKKEIRENLLGQVLIGGILIVVVGCLVAPMFHNMLSKPLREKMFTPNATVEEIKRYQDNIKSLKVVLWVVAVLAWIFIIVANIGPRYTD